MKKMTMLRGYDPIEELDEEYFMQLRQGVFVPYLEMLQKDLDHREER